MRKFNITKASGLVGPLFHPQIAQEFAQGWGIVGSDRPHFVGGIGQSVPRDHDDGDI